MILGAAAWSLLRLSAPVRLALVGAILCPMWIAVALVLL
jgi:hypothetical protein